MEDIQEPRDAIYRKVSLATDKWLEWHKEEWFSYYDVLNYHEWKERASREALSKKLYYESSKNNPGLQKRNRLYRVVEVNGIEMDIVGANPKDVFSIRLPFGLERYVKLFRGNVAVIYGSKDAGKTAFLLNLMKLNLGKHEIVYQNVDMGDAELRLRLEKFPDITMQQWQQYVHFYERSYGFSDLVGKYPDAINIVDYLEVHTDFYAIGQPIKEMADKSRNGILFVALQKNPGAELPLGKGRGLERAKLAINLDPGKITIAVAKNWQDGITSSPKGKSWKYKLVGGALIKDIQEE